MQKSIFRKQLNNATDELFSFTSKMVINKLSRNIVYIIEPNCREQSHHLSDKENEKLIELNQLENQLLDYDTVINYLHIDDSVPLWINTQVYKSSKKRTIIKLICSRRFRKESELNMKADKFPPFHILVPVPPYYKQGKMFNINWHQKTFRLKLHSKILDWKNRKFQRETLKKTK